MRKFGISIVTTPEELRSIASMLEEHQKNHPDRYMRVSVNWYHSTVTYINDKSPEVRAEMEGANSDLVTNSEIEQRAKEIGDVVSAISEGATTASVEREAARHLREVSRVKVMTTP